jgi:Ribonuclease toxin, BrnT, of type II toxin-antitoxin system
VVQEGASLAGKDSTEHSSTISNSVFEPCLPARRLRLPRTKKPATAKPANPSHFPRCRILISLSPFSNRFPWLAPYGFSHSIVPESLVNGRPFQFEWNEVKANANSRRHGVSFELACTVFHDPRILTVADLQHSESEEPGSQSVVQAMVQYFRSFISGLTPIPR